MNEIVMAAQQLQGISSDYPAKSIAVDSNDNVWILGNRYLWQWVPYKGDVQRFKLSTDKPMKNLFVSGEHLFASNNEQIFQLEQ